MSVLFGALGLALIAFSAGWAVLAVWPWRKMAVLRYLLPLVAVLLTSIPLSVLLTLVLLPFWTWLEATLGIESIGHSGPAEWCFVAMFLTCLVILGCTGLLMAKRRPREESS